MILLVSGTESILKTYSKLSLNLYKQCYPCRYGAIYQPYPITSILTKVVKSQIAQISNYLYFLDSTTA